MSEQPTVQWEPLKVSRQFELEFRAWQEEAWGKIFSTYALTPAQLGVARNLNASYAEMQEKAFKQHIDRIVANVSDKEQGA